VKHRPSNIVDPTSQALLRIYNHTDIVLDAEGKPVVSGRAANQPAEGAPPADGMLEVDSFNPEKLPLKTPLVKSVTTGETPVNFIPYHSDAPYFLRRHLMEAAKKHFKELDRADTNTLLTHSH